MSQQPVALDAVPVLQPTAGNRVRLSPHELHPRLQRAARLSRGAPGTAAVDLTQLLPVISDYYEQLDDERRGIVRSMQLIADEARSYGEGLGGVDAGHWQVILDHIKDVVITAGADGAVKMFNPTGERVFGLRARTSSASRSRCCCRTCRCRARWSRVAGADDLAPTTPAATCGHTRPVLATKTDTSSRRS